MKKVSTLIEKTERHALQFDDGEIRQILKTLGHDIPAKAEIFVYVPGGGDWSNMSLDISKDTPLQITWEVTTTEVSES